MFGFRSELLWMDFVRWRGCFSLKGTDLLTSPVLHSPPGRVLIRHSPLLFVSLSLCDENVLRSGFFKYTRNPNYLGERTPGMVDRGLGAVLHSWVAHCTNSSRFGGRPFHTLDLPCSSNALVW